MLYDNIPGRSRENAKKALALAEERGFPPESVRTTRDGYQIPLAEDAVKDDPKVTPAAKPVEKKPTEAKPARKRTNKKE